MKKILLEDLMFILKMFKNFKIFIKEQEERVIDRAKRMFEKNEHLMEIKQKLMEKLKL